MKTTLFSVVAGIFWSGMAFGMGTRNSVTTALVTTFTAVAIAITTATPTLALGANDGFNSLEVRTVDRDGKKISITETKGLFYEKKADGSIVQLENETSKNIKGLSLGEVIKKLDTPNCEERFFATWQYRSIIQQPHKLMLKENDDWNNVIRKLIIDLYWTSNDETGDYAFAQAIASAALILLEQETVKYFENNELNRYEDTTLKGAIMMNILEYIAKEKKELIPRIKNIVDPGKYWDDKSVQVSSRYLIELLDKYQKEK